MSNRGREGVQREVMLMAMSSEKIISLAEAKTNNPLCKFIFEFVDAKIDLAESAKDLKGRVILVSNSLDSYDNLIKVFTLCRTRARTFAL